tara:strand:- start:6762 stop:7403 length:642 start_codon:yes stop_codon:yes gene_type:complete
MANFTKEQQGSQNFQDGLARMMYEKQFATGGYTPEDIMAIAGGDTGRQNTYNRGSKINRDTWSDHRDKLRAQRPPQGPQMKTSPGFTDSPRMSNGYYVDNDSGFDRGYPGINPPQMPPTGLQLGPAESPNETFADYGDMGGFEDAAARSQPGYQTYNPPMQNAPLGYGSYGGMNKPRGYNSPRTTFNMGATGGNPGYDQSQSGMLQYLVNGGR